jgi:hypothetical protein
VLLANKHSDKRLDNEYTFHGVILCIVKLCTVLLLYVCSDLRKRGRNVSVVGERKSATSVISGIRRDCESVPVNFNAKYEP